MQYKYFKISNYDDFYKKELPEIRKICQDCNVHVSYLMAIKEAVCNGFRYNRAGLYTGEVIIRMIISDIDINTMIQAETITFDVDRFYKKIRSLADNPDTAKLDWGEYLHDSEGGRGFWYMMYGSDLVQISASPSGSSEVSLFISYPSPEDRIMTIENLVNKVFVKNNGVVV